MCRIERLGGRVRCRCCGSVSRSGARLNMSRQYRDEDNGDRDRDVITKAQQRGEERS
jgi:hypothetical protein